MRNLNKVAMLFASAAIASAVGAQTGNGNGNSAGAIDNWRATDGTVWMNGTNEHCWRDANWTKETAASVKCGAPAMAQKMAEAAKAAPVKVEPPKAAPPKAAPPKAEPPKAAPPKAEPAKAATAVPVKVTYGADAFFDTDKYALKPEGKAKLDDLTSKVKDINLEVIIAVGHTDSTGGVAHNQKLSVHRAEAVKAYLVSHGIEKNRVYTEGKGEKQPVADNKTKEGRAKNRRVEIEVVGTKTTTK